MELLKWIEQKENPVKNKHCKYFDVCFVGAVCLVTLIIGLLYSALSKTVYFWDDATYWEIGRMLAEKPLSFDFFATIYKSIGVSDYNYLPALPVALWMKVFGLTRISYIGCIITIYLIPIEILVYLLSKKISKAPLLTFIIAILIIPALPYLTYIGFIDIGGCLIGLFCYYLYFVKKDGEHEWLRYVLLGVMLTLIMVFRRYFAFFSVSFITTMIIDCILLKKDKKMAALTILSAGLTLVIFFFPFLVNILLKDYGTLYSGYKYNLVTDLKLITRYFGLMFLICAIAAVPLSIVKRKEDKGIFALLQMIICAIMFVSTQTHGQQHLLLYVPGLIILVMVLINSIDKEWMLVALCAVTAVTAVSPYIDRVQPQNIQEIKGLSVVPSYSMKPKRRSDINQILSLKTKLDKAIPEGKKCGVLASSFSLNSSILINVEPSLNRVSERKDNYIIGLPEVDSRDYWRLNEIYTCDYILVAYPGQTHLAPGQQTIIDEAVASFSEDKDIAKAFRRVNNFEFKINDIDVKLYERIGEVTKTEQAQFEMRIIKKEG